MERIKALRALLTQTEAAEQALRAEEYERFAELVTARGEAMAALDADGQLGEGMTGPETLEAIAILRSIQAVDQRMAVEVSDRLGDTRTEIGQQQLATSTVSAYRKANRRVASPQFAARFVDKQK